MHAMYVINLCVFGNVWYFLVVVVVVVVVAIVFSFICITFNSPVCVVARTPCQMDTTNCFHVCYIHTYISSIYATNVYLCHCHCIVEV